MMQGNSTIFQVSAFDIEIIEVFMKAHLKMAENKRIYLSKGSTRYFQQFQSNLKDLALWIDSQIL